MSTLVPRIFGDLADWFETDRQLFTGHLIRVEDEMTDQEYRLRAEVPGVDPEKDITVTVDQGVLYIRAQRREEETTASRSEFRYGSMQRTIRLPGNADSEKIKATYEHGVLSVVVPLKAAEPAGRVIPIAAK